MSQLLMRALVGLTWSFEIDSYREKFLFTSFMEKGIITSQSAFSS